MEDITNFWAGEKLSVSRVKQGLKQVGSAGMFDMKTVPARILAAQRLRFAARLITAAGFAGWIVLTDEAETRLPQMRSSRFFQDCELSLTNRLGSG